MKPGKRMREILDILQDGQEAWTSGELWNDAGMWSVSSVAADGVRYARRCQADPARRLHEQGYVMYARIDKGLGQFGADRVVWTLTQKGRRA